MIDIDHLLMFTFFSVVTVFVFPRVKEHIVISGVVKKLMVSVRRSGWEYFYKSKV